MAEHAVIVDAVRTPGGKRGGGLGGWHAADLASEVSPPRGDATTSTR